MERTCISNNASEAYWAIPLLLMNYHHKHIHTYTKPKRTRRVIRTHAQLDHLAARHQGVPRTSDCRHWSVLMVFLCDLSNGFLARALDGRGLIEGVRCRDGGCAMLGPCARGGCACPGVDTRCALHSLACGVGCCSKCCSGRKGRHRRVSQRGHDAPHDETAIISIRPPPSSSSFIPEPQQ